MTEKQRSILKKFQQACILFACLMFSLNVSAQNSKSISGTVADATGEAIIGASVLVKGTTNGAITDADGSFRINAADNAILAISYIGYVAQEIPVAGKSQFHIVLKEDNQLLNEVVVIGYGSQTKKELTGSITSIKADNFNKGISSNPMGLIQGKVAGLVIIKNGGDDPAQNNYNVQLRGAGSLNASIEPLYIIDGIPGGNLSSVNPNDIESVDVLKDGSAAAIYGTRANAGVILITTKRGKGAGRMTTEYSGTVSAGMITNTPKIMSAQEYRDKMVANGFGIDYAANTDWIKAITRAPISTTHNVAISNGGENYNYRASIGYKSLQGLAIKSDYEEINARFAANQKALNNLLELAYDFGYTTDTKAWANYDNFNQALRSNPTMPIRTDDPAFAKYGGYYESDNFYTRNPVSDIEQTTNDQKDQVVMGSIRATLNLGNHLRLSTFYSLQNNSTWVGKYQARTLHATAGQDGAANQSQSYEKQQVIENTLQYLNHWKAHNLQFLLGQGYQTNLYQGFNAYNTIFPLDKIGYNNLGMGEGLKSGESAKANMGSYQYNDKLASYFARAIYNYNQRYFLNASVRFEGSSKFGKEADPTLGPWGIFPAISGSWNIKSEEFMKNVNLFNDLKLRVGYGVTGNMPYRPNDLHFGHYLYASLVGPDSNNTYVFDGTNFILPWTPMNTQNPHLKWEEKHETNVGIDFAILNNRLSGSVDAYYRHTTNLLMQYQERGTAQGLPVWGNYGIIDNRGLELQLNGVIVKTRNLDWNIGFNAAWNNNKAVRITGEQAQAGVEYFINTGYISSGDGETGNYVMRLAEGQPIGNFYGFKYYGINDKGEWVFNTPAGGFTTNPQDADKMILGNAQPFMTFGFNTGVRYKAFDLTANFRGQIGGLIFNETRYFYENTRGVENALSSAFKGDALLMTAWKTSGSTNASIRRFSDFYLENASYIKLNDLTIGYSPLLSESWRKYVNNVRITLTGQNLFTLTGYSGHDPASVSMAGLTPGFDGRSYYPTQRSFNLGLSFTF